MNELIKTLDTELGSASIDDYCPNGLQVEGRSQVNKVLTGVTASLALIDQAIALKADAILVHHGYFWKGESQVIKGMKKRRIEKLLAHGISLIAYHLPLDVHPQLGNNAQLGKLLNIKNCQVLGQNKPLGIIWAGELNEAMSHSALCDYLSTKLSRSIVSVGNKDIISNIAWCTGGGQNFIDDIPQLTLNGQPIDAYLSGEISEQTTHSALEQNIDFFAAGHHASERYGVKALGEWLCEKYALEVDFIDIDNPA